MPTRCRISRHRCRISRHLAGVGFRDTGVGFRDTGVAKSDTGYVADIPEIHHYPNRTQPPPKYQTHLKSQTVNQFHMKLLLNSPEKPNCKPVPM